MTKKISLADWQQLNPNADAQSSHVKPSSDKPDHTQLVYSTDGGSISTAKADKAAGVAYPDGVVRIKRESKGRGGKTVLTISGIAQSHASLTALCAQLKKKAACGGTVKDGIIEIQADKRELISELLQQSGFKVKQAGG